MHSETMTIIADTVLNIHSHDSYKILLIDFNEFLYTESQKPCQEKPLSNILRSKRHLNF